MRRKWLNSPEALDGIVGTLGAQALALRRMQDEPYQVRGLVGGGMGVRVGEREHSAGGRPLQGAEQPSPVRRAALCAGSAGRQIRGYWGVGWGAHTFGASGR